MARTVIEDIRTKENVKDRPDGFLKRRNLEVYENRVAKGTEKLELMVGSQPAHDILSYLNSWTDQQLSNSHEEPYD